MVIHFPQATTVAVPQVAYATVTLSTEPKALNNHPPPITNHHMILDIPATESSLIQELLPFLKPSKTHQVWIVGGFIRDLLNNKKECFDIDLTLSFNPLRAAREYAQSTNSGLVILDDERHIVRVVRTLDNGKSYTFDLSEFRAENIDGDLKARDFTFNAIAASLFENNNLLKNNKIELYDPLHGVDALKNRILTPCSDSLFEDDPLRIMRAFRFSALYNSDLSADLLRLIDKHKDSLSNISGERIRDELFKIFTVSDSFKWIRLIDKSGLFRIIIPELEACHGVSQNEWHHLDVFDHSLLSLEKLEILLNIPAPHNWWKELQSYLNEQISGPRTYLQILKFGCLLHDIGKVPCKDINPQTGKIIFHRHEVEGAKMMKDICERLRLSTKELSFLQNLVKNHMRPGIILQQGISDKRLYRYYNECGRDGLGICLVCLADRYSALGANVSNEYLISFAAGIYQIMDVFYQQSQKTKIKPLLNGNEIMAIFNLKPGPIIKKLLDALEEAQYAEEISNKEEAVNLLTVELTKLNK